MEIRADGGPHGTQTTGYGIADPLSTRAPGQAPPASLGPLAHEPAGEPPSGSVAALKRLARLCKTLWALRDCVFGTRFCAVDL